MSAKTPGGKVWREAEYFPRGPWLKRPRRKSGTRRRTFAGAGSHSQKKVSAEVPEGGPRKESKIWRGSARWTVPRMDLLWRGMAWKNQTRKAPMKGRLAAGAGSRKSALQSPHFTPDRQNEFPINCVAESNLEHDESPDDKSEQHPSRVRRSFADLGQK